MWSRRERGERGRETAAPSCRKGCALHGSCGGRRRENNLFAAAKESVAANAAAAVVGAVVIVVDAFVVAFAVELLKQLSK